MCTRLDAEAAVTPNWSKTSTCLHVERDWSVHDPMLDYQIWLQSFFALLTVKFTFATFLMNCIEVKRKKNSSFWHLHIIKAARNYQDCAENQQCMIHDFSLYITKSMEHLLLAPIHSHFLLFNFQLLCTKAQAAQVDDGEIVALPPSETFQIFTFYQFYLVSRTNTSLVSLEKVFLAKIRFAFRNQRQQSFSLFNG